MDIRIAGTVDDSIVDGPGFRYTVFTQGCSHHCPGCHNPETHDFAGGRTVDTDAIVAQMRANPLLDGLTLSGGDPMEQPAPCAELARQAHALGLNVWCYTGYTLEQLLQGVAGVAPYVQAQGVGLPGQLRAGCGLLHGIAPGEGQPVQQGIGPHLRHDGIRVHRTAPGKVVGLGIVAARAVVGAALGEHRVTEARPVHDGVIHRARNADVHTLTPPRGRRRASPGRAPRRAWRC